MTNGIKQLERTHATLLKDLQRVEAKASEAKAIYNSLATQANHIRSQCRQLERTIQYLKPVEEKKEEIAQAATLTDDDVPF